MEYDMASSLFFYVVYAPLLGGIPILYVTYVNFDVLIRSKLLPKDPRARQFAIYFLRIIVVFFIWYIPCLIFVFMVAKTNPWVTWSWVFWAHWQSTGSSLLCLLKPDIWEATKNLVLCRRGSDNVFVGSVIFGYLRRSGTKDADATMEVDHSNSNTLNMNGLSESYTRRSILDELAVYPAAASEESPEMECSTPSNFQTRSFVEELAVIPVIRIKESFESDLDTNLEMHGDEEEQEETN